uniref:hypothetical protein n=1 Tax=Aeromonas sp. Ne-1 TaxID=1675689 RepID=UPI00156371C3|nr:hypothetical protein [Aeromonas sp. Ne-1]
MCYPIVIGLNVIEDENEDSLLYTNRDMLNEGVFIELSDYVEDENNHFQTLLSINHVNSNKVDIYTICEGT